MTVPLPENETARLQALSEYAILDTPAEPAFDDLARLAARLCHAPIAIINVIAAQRQWFKATVGWDVSGASRDAGFCPYTILQRHVFTVADASADDRFATSPLVAAPPRVRFYAGVPLVTGAGLAIGTLCVMDSVPRALSAVEKESLQALARQVMAQLELRRARAAGSQASQRADLISTVAHDIKNPLSVILGYADILWDEAAARGAAEEQDIIEQVKRNTLTVLALVSNYFDLSKIEGGHLRLTKKPLALNDLLTHIGAQYEAEAGHNRITLECNFDEGLPAVEADQFALERIFGNLMHNALKFTPEFGRIEISSARRNGGVVAVVSDTGVGITAAELETVFERYRRAKGSRNGEGAGLGLFVVKTLVEAHGGRIEVESTPGQGSRFSVFFPVKSTDRAA